MLEVPEYLQDEIDSTLVIAALNGYHIKTSESEESFPSINYSFKKPFKKEINLNLSFEKEKLYVVIVNMTRGNLYASSSEADGDFLVPIYVLKQYLK